MQSNNTKRILMLVKDTIILLCLVLKHRNSLVKDLQSTDMGNINVNINMDNKMSPHNYSAATRE